jgi:hypothetical protein
METENEKASYQLDLFPEMGIEVSWLDSSHAWFYLDARGLRLYADFLHRINSSLPVSCKRLQ